MLRIATSVRRAWLLGLALAIAVCDTACGSHPRTWELSRDTGAEQLSSAVLTSTGSEGYDLTIASAALTVSASPAMDDANIRDVVWPADLQAGGSSETCATWASASSRRAQEGLALDIRRDGADVSALTVTVNVIYGVRWELNVHHFDSADRANPFVLLDQWNFKSVLTHGAAEVPLPWRTCARISGSTLQFKVWLPGKMAEPGWDDPKYARTLTSVPKPYLSAGAPGWYVGHVPPGGAVTYRALFARVA